MPVTDRASVLLFAPAAGHEREHRRLAGLMSVVYDGHDMTALLP
jgi:hypothetical protein